MSVVDRHLLSFSWNQPQLDRPVWSHYEDQDGLNISGIAAFDSKIQYYLKSNIDKFI